MKLTREQFRAQTFERDSFVCVIPGCGREAVDPHHIIDRALWLKNDPCPEGYLLVNGASLCEKHHIAAEENHYPPQALRRWIGCSTVLPKQLDKDKLWNKWGEEIARPVNTKWARTPYLDFSPSIDAEDDTIESSKFLGKPLVVTVKMDGANVTLTREKVTSRNGDTANHPQFDLLKAMHGGFKYLIPENVIVYGEWLYAKHSIHYTGELALDSPLMIFAIYEPEHELLWSWDETVEFCKENDFVTVPVVGNIETNADWELQSNLWDLFEKTVSQGHEGIVVRNVYPLHFGQWGENAGKMVREDHNQSDDWKDKPITKNEINK